MFISIDFITGFTVGVEYLEEESTHYFIIDLGIVRVLVEKFKKTS
jgi:hypothetical protein